MHFLTIEGPLSAYSFLKIHILRKATREDTIEPPQQEQPEEDKAEQPETPAQEPLNEPEEDKTEQQEGQQQNPAQQKEEDGDAGEEKIEDKQVIEAILQSLAEQEDSLRGKKKVGTYMQWGFY